MEEFSDDDIHDTLREFEAAVHAEKIEFPAVELRKILLVLDGSNQDAAAEQLALVLAQKNQASIHLTFAYEGARDAAREDYLRTRADALGREGIVSSCSRAEEERPFRQMVALSRTENCDLIVVCAPYLDDFYELGAASIGTNLDLLLAHRETPLLIVREPRECMSFEHIVPLLNCLTDQRGKLGGWSFRLASEHTQFNLLAVVATEALETARFAGAQIDASRIDEIGLSGLGQPEMSGFAAAMQRKATDLNIGCRVSVRIGPATAEIATFCNQLQGIVALNCPRDPGDPLFERVHAIIRESSNPVLVI